MSGEAILSSSGEYTLFSYDGRNIRFKTSPKLERYVNVREWDNGYLVVTARYSGKDEEEYIDLVPILRNLYIDPTDFLSSVEKVRISYD